MEVKLLANETVTIGFGDDGSVSARWSSSGIRDEFTEPERETISTAGTEQPFRTLESHLRSLRQHEGEGGAAYEAVIINDGESTVIASDTLPSELQSFLDSFDPYEIGLEEQSSSVPVRMDADRLESLLSEGKISRDVYDSNIARIRGFEDRRRIVQGLLEDRRYMSERDRKDIVADHDMGLITDDEYSMFVWYSRNIGGLKRNDGTMMSVKLKLSVWGLRIGGRFDTFEFIVDREDRELVDRSYCVHGTLFEGCGNYKAPDAARHTELTEERTELIFDYLGQLERMDILGKNYSEPRYDCGFFDLYVRYSDRDSVHTKGTTEYPYFIKYLMYLMGAEEGI